MNRAVVWIVLGVGLLAPAIARGKVRARRTLKRSVDTVVLECGVLGDKILGVHKNRLRVYACRAGFMVPITYQLDEKNAEGVYCYDKGKEDRRLRDEDNGNVDANDELVVLAREAGDRAIPRTLAMVPNHAAVQEVTLKDPLDGSEAWIYVYRFDTSAVPGRTDTDLAGIEVKLLDDDEQGEYTWWGEGFRFDNKKSPLNAVRATYASYLQPDGSWSKNVFDCTWVKATVSFMWYTTVRKSDDVKVQIGGYIDGPIRVVAENMLQVHLALGFYVSAPASYVIMWPNRVSMPTNVSSPVNLDESDESSYTLCMDMSNKLTGWRFFNSHNTTPVVVDGVMSPAEKQLDMTYPDWNCIYGPEGGLLAKFVIPKELVGRTTNQLYYMDDKTLIREGDLEGLEFEDGTFGTTGFHIDMRGLKKGVYSGDYVVWYLKSGFQPGEEVGYLNEYDHPIVAEATTE
ncbi:MAG: hypothetical protein R3F62_31540 [Planctomycetota bacterium]